MTEKEDLLEQIENKFVNIKAEKHIKKVTIGRDWISLYTRGFVEYFVNINRAGNLLNVEPHELMQFLEAEKVLNKDLKKKYNTSQ